MPSAHATLFAEEMREDHAKLDFYDLGLSEILISPESKLINQTIEDAGFRQRNNVNVLAIKRAGRCISDEMQQQTIHSGDMMLVHGAWNDIKKMKTNLREWIIIGDPAEELENVALDHKAPLAAGIMIAMVALMVFADQIGIPPVTTVIVAGLLMVLLGCVRSVDTAYKMIGWESIVLIAAGSMWSPPCSPPSFPIRPRPFSLPPSLGAPPHSWACRPHPL